MTLTPTDWIIAGLAAAVLVLMILDYRGGLTIRRND
jgi:hypothetical protein